MDSLFQSFNTQVSMNNFAELSGCVFTWIEEQCKPGDLQVQCTVHTAHMYAVRNQIYHSLLQDLMYDILRQTVKKESENSYEPLDPAYQRN